MFTLIRLLAQAIARPIEAAFRSRAPVGDGRFVKIGNLNHALVPFFISLIFWGLLTALLVASRNSGHLKDEGPFLIGCAAFALIAFGIGTRQTLWVHIDESFWLCRLFSAKQYRPDQISQWWFVWPGPKRSQ